MAYTGANRNGETHLAEMKRTAPTRHGYPLGKLLYGTSTGGIFGRTCKYERCTGQRSVRADAASL
jgi:hypothetical protein